MKAGIMAATGDDNPLSPEEKGDLEYRRSQLKRLQEEVVDIEEMSTGVSIMDLGLNEFRLDLTEYLKGHESQDIMDRKPKGLHAVVPENADCPPGAIFVLRNLDNGVNLESRNRIHPFYMVYVDNAGGIVCDHLNPKRLLDLFRHLCRGRGEPIKDLCRRFNEETDDGRNMKAMSRLLGHAIDSIVHLKDQDDVQAFLGGGYVDFVKGAIQGLDDFELVCFLVVR